MEKIESFKIDHTRLKRGVFLSRVDCEDCYTYDVRVCQPYVDELMDVRAMHTIEHLMATFLRSNEKVGKCIVYTGGMLCRTGYYVVVKQLTHYEVITALQECFLWISKFEGEIPGATKIECGSYQEHDLEEAKKIAKRFYDEVLSDLRYENLHYPNN